MTTFELFPSVATQKFFLPPSKRSGKQRKPCEILLFFCFSFWWWTELKVARKVTSWCCCVLHLFTEKRSPSWIGFEVKSSHLYVEGCVAVKATDACWSSWCDILQKRPLVVWFLAAISYHELLCWRRANELDLEWCHGNASHLNLLRLLWESCKQRQWQVCINLLQCITLFKTN